MITQARETSKPPARLNRLLAWLGVPRSSWYGQRKDAPNRPGRKAKPVPEDLAVAIRQLAEQYPWWGYKRIAVIARRLGIAVSNKQAYRVMKAAGHVRICGSRRRVTACGDLAHEDTINEVCQSTRLATESIGRNSLSGWLGRGIKPNCR